MSTQRLFELGLSFGVCKRQRRWPSLVTMNSFLRLGTDEGTLATDIEWEPCELTQEQYKCAITAFMGSEPFQMDAALTTWESWFAELNAKPVA